MSTGAVAGRDAFLRRAWREAYTYLSNAHHKSLEPADLERLAISAQLIAEADCADRWLRAHEAWLRIGDRARAARCAFWLAQWLTGRGELARGGGWFATARRLIDAGGLDCVERGYLLLPEAIGYVDRDPAAALARFESAVGIGARFDDPDLITLARMGQGRALIRLGGWTDAVAALDQAMIAVTGDDVSPIVAGLVYCGAIEACQEIFDLRRAREWSTALARWCDAQPDLVAFQGECLVHRAEIMQVDGEWPQALGVARRAHALLTGEPAVGEALYRLGEAHRLLGAYPEAEHTYREALKVGREPQPGLALLWLAQGRVKAANDAIRRVVEEATGAATRARVLGAAVEIFLAAGDVIVARGAADELDALAAEIDTPYLRGVTACASGAVLLAEGNQKDALPRLRVATSIWRELAAPYELARATVLIGLACRALDDRETAQLELESARSAFRSLGAMPDAGRVDALLKQSSGGLTAREIEVLALVAKGRSNRQIAGALRISEHTVARHVQNICAKLGVSSRTAAASFAYEHRLL